MKLVIRNIPPNLSEEEFRKLIAAPLQHASTFYYLPGKHGQRGIRFATAFLTFDQPIVAQAVINALNEKTLTDGESISSVLQVVEAPFQVSEPWTPAVAPMPTIEDDDDYQLFINMIGQAPPALADPPAPSRETPAVVKTKIMLELEEKGRKKAELRAQNRGRRRNGRGNRNGRRRNKDRRDGCQGQEGDTRRDRRDGDDRGPRRGRRGRGRGGGHGQGPGPGQMPPMQMGPPMGPPMHMGMVPPMGHPMGHPMGMGGMGMGYPQ